MKAPGVLDGVIAALLISLGAGAASLLLGSLLIYPTLHSVVLSAASLVYLLYLLKRSTARIGRIVVVSAWLVLTLICWTFDASLIEQILLQATMIWLVRSLYFHQSIFTALLDLGLVSVGLAVSAWAMINTGSLVVSLWAFFLVQALFCWLPELSRRQLGGPDDSRHNRSSFQSAHRVAVDAVRKLSQI
jgi:hypothetical protein